MRGRSVTNGQTTGRVGWASRRLMSRHNPSQSSLRCAPPPQSTGSSPSSPTCYAPCYRWSERKRPMIAEILSHREELDELCRRFHVRRLDLFGSAAGDDFDAERSDLDFLVEFEPTPRLCRSTSFSASRKRLKRCLAAVSTLSSQARFAIRISKRVSSARVSPSLRRDPKSLGQATILHALRHSWSAPDELECVRGLAPRPRMRPTR